MKQPATSQQPTKNQQASDQAINQAQPATKGAGGRGEAFRFAAPPKGEQGVMGPLMKILQILSLEGPRPCRRPLQSCARTFVFFGTYFRESFLHANEPK